MQCYTTFSTISPSDRHATVHNFCATQPTCRLGSIPGRDTSLHGIPTSYADFDPERLGGLARFAFRFEPATRKWPVIWQKRSDVYTNFRAAGCFCLVDGSLLVMQRQRHKAFGLHWAIPTGKIERYETPRECIARELWEEIGLSVDAQTLEELSCWIVENEGQRFEYIAFVLHLDELPDLRLNAEEVRKIEWVPLLGIRKRRVVPYFYNTVQDLLDWEQFEAFQPAMLPVPEAKSAGRRRA